MTAPTRTPDEQAALGDALAVHRGNVAELAEAYRTIRARGLDDIATASCLIALIDRTMCRLTTARTLVAAVTKVEDYRVELVAKGNDLLNIRGALSPSGYARRVPMEIGKEVAPVIDWVLDDRDRLRRELDQARACLRKVWELTTWEDGEDREDIPAAELVDALKTGPDPHMDYSAAEEALIAEASRADVDRHRGPLAAAGGDPR